MYYLFFIFFLSSACSSMSDDNVKFAYGQEIEEEKKYISVFKKNSKYIELYENFETSYFINSSYFSEDFLQEFNNKKAKVLSGDLRLLEDENDYFIFLVSIFGPDQSLTDLSDKKQWVLELKIGNKKISPTKVSLLKKEHPWNIFFSYINDWSDEYLVFFSKEEFLNKISESEQSQKKIELILANSQGKTSMKW